MERAFKFFIMMLDRNMNLILTTSLMNTTPRMGVSGWLLSLCICIHQDTCALWALSLVIKFALHLPIDDNLIYFLFMLSTSCVHTAPKSKKVVRQFSPMPEWTAVLCHTTMSCLNVARRALLLNQRWEMQYFSGAWSPMPLLIRPACTVSLYGCLAKKEDKNLLISCVSKS